MMAQVIRRGKALYFGISSYNAEQTEQAIRIMRELGTPILIHQPLYNMFNRWVEVEATGSIADSSWLRKH